MENVNKNNVLQEEDESVSRKLDEKLMELHSLFELSQTLNSSLNVTAILDNILLTPMGKMLISKGIVFLNQGDNVYKVQTLKGLSHTLIGKTIKVTCECSGPVFIKEMNIETNPWITFFKEHSIEIILPIRSSNNILGIIGFGKKILNTSYLKSEIDFLNSLSNIAATAIENGLMVFQLQEVNRKLDKKVQELNTLFDIGKELNSTLDADKILNLLCYATMGEMMVNRLMVFTKDNGKMQLAISKGHQDPSELIQFKQLEFLNPLEQIDDSFLVHDLTHNQIFADVLMKAGFEAIIPMRIQNETKGLMVIGERINKVKFSQDDLEFLFTLGNEAMICLENARLFEETLEKQRIEEELDIAREIQQKLLPKSCPELKNFEIAAMNIPSRQVGGDYYDCIQLDEHHICIAIADVSGKGIPASLLMANLQASLHAIAEPNMNISDIAGRINNIIHNNTGFDKFITFFYGILDVVDNTFTYVNAGHNPPYLFEQDGTFQLLDKGGLILGMMPNMVYQQEKVALQKNDFLVMFTDGVSEARNNQDEEFEEQRIEKIIKSSLPESATGMMNNIYDAVKVFSKGVPQSDDITMVVVKVR